ncbi:hypothetical protein JW933_04870 [candidate division FCPU426 bacterium]|nr:hypothetical protein [candidate division FCPU426 bacterium]
MRIAVCFNQPDSQLPDAVDIHAEVGLVTEMLQSLGHTFRLFPFQINQNVQAESLQGLRAYAPEVVFNLVESYGDDPRIQAEVAGWWESLKIPYTGCPAEALLTTTDKTLAKVRLIQAGINTPPWQIYDNEPFTVSIPPPWICKPAWEDASVGINDQAVVYEHTLLLERLRLLSGQHPGQPLLVETFIDGREFNVSLLEAEDQTVEAMPPAELVFQSWPAEKPRIVNYAAKWIPDSLEYIQIQRSFEITAALSKKLNTVARKCWKVFRLRGYARIDCRQDRDGRLYVIEINANPGIAPDSGFIAATARKGHAPAEVIRRILAAARNTFSRKVGAVPCL